MTYKFKLQQFIIVEPGTSNCFPLNGTTHDIPLPLDKSAPRLFPSEHSAAMFIRHWRMGRKVGKRVVPMAGRDQVKLDIEPVTINYTVG